MAVMVKTWPREERRGSVGAASASRRPGELLEAAKGLS